MSRLMIDRVLVALALVVGSVALSANVYGSGGSNSGGGGGSDKTITVKYTGYITNMELTEYGVVVTIGTSYYNTGKVLVTPDTQIKVNGINALIEDIEVGDWIGVVATWPTNVASKIEAIVP